MRRRAMIAVAGGVALSALGAAAFLRVGLLDLPAVPDDLTPERAGVEGFERLARDEQLIASGTLPAAGGASEATALAAEGIAALRAGETERGLELLERAVRLEPSNLVLGNALRMEVFRLKRDWRLAADGAAGPLAELPAHLEERPLAFFRRLAETTSVPEARLQLAASLLDEMLLEPALEVRAGVTVEAMRILAELLEEEGGGGPYYLPALYARGLVYLHRPANLLWNESIENALAAARDDLALCVAVGRELDVGSSAVQGRLALALGDTYAKEGRPDRARSWWQIADAMGEGELRPRVMQRMAWRDRELLDRLEEELEREMRDLERPMSDMSVLWR